MSHWLTTNPSTSQVAAASALATELRTEAARFDIIRDLLDRAHRAMPDPRDCEGWAGRSRTAFDERVAALVDATRAGAQHADIAAETCTRQARAAEEVAAFTAVASVTP